LAQERSCGYSLHLAPRASCRPVVAKTGMPGDSTELAAENSRNSQLSEDTDGASESTVEIPQRPVVCKPWRNDREVLAARRKMQQQRKALLAEMQPAPKGPSAIERALRSRGSQSASLSGSKSALSSTLKLSSPESAILAEGLSREEADVPMSEPRSRDSMLKTSPAAFPKRPAPTYVAKVERFHRHMIRKEVWGQKFNFIYRQVQQELADSEEQEDTLGGTMGSAGGTQSVTFSTVQSRRSRAQTPTVSMPPTPAAGPSALRRQISTSTPRAAFLTEHPVGDSPSSVARSVRPSTSLPSLIINQHLSMVQQEYYGGDDLLMHEDILHSSNPRLFPLRPVPTRPFSAANLPALLAY